MNKEWSELNKTMQTQIKKKDTYEAGIDVVKIKIVFCVLIMGTFLFACGQSDNNEIVVQEMEIINGENEEKSTEIDTERVGANKIFFMEELELSEIRATGTANRLEKCGCGRIVELKDRIDGEKAYQITLVNDRGEKFYTAFDMNGFIGSIKDEEGNYLYTPID